MPITTKIGERIKELRSRLGISQEALAHLADLDRTYVNSVENGKRNISIENIEKIAKALNVSVKEFFDDKRFS
ncbi:MAG TPA: helix-turn-helix transcriptional regulator [Pyrinomonadaceae bacterium]|nr:helix-turn-helix transcriptional regulator [Pyrinomonadaceae bacterium]